MPIRVLVFLAGVLVITPLQQSFARQYTGGENLTEVWQRYLDDQTGIEPAYRFPYDYCFHRASIVNQVPQTLLLAVARGESDFNASARSHANAHGLMQILWPSTARHLGLYRLSELYDPCKNVDAGARYLKELMKRYEGDLHLTLAAYNYGPHRIVATADIPSGAEWYSGYIYRHLNYVLGNRAGDKKDDGVRNYFDEGKLELVVFSEPYRARAFVKALERDAPDLRIDWFRSGPAHFKVVLLYEGEHGLADSKARLARAGFRMK